MLEGEKRERARERESAREREREDREREREVARREETILTDIVKEQLHIKRALLEGPPAQVSELRGCKHKGNVVDHRSARGTSADGAWLNWHASCLPV